MKNIALYNQKGGVGKTTSTVNIAMAAAQQGAKCLLVDADPQGNSTIWLSSALKKKDRAGDLQTVLAGQKGIEEVIIRARENLDLIPTFALSSDLKSWSETNLSQEPYAFEDLIHQGIKPRKYDYIFWDISPSFSILEKSILAQMQEIVIVTASEFFSLAGMKALQQNFVYIKTKLRGKFNSDIIIVNRLNRAYSSHRLIYTKLEESGKKIFTIKQSTKISDCTTLKKTLLEYDPKNENLGTYKQIFAAIKGEKNG